MRDLVMVLIIFTGGYWFSHFFPSLNIGFALTIVSFAIPTLLYFLNHPNVDRKSFPETTARR